jgi:phosphoenolpyruvate-protein kinase (PTS system EI component)
MAADPVLEAAVAAAIEERRLTAARRCSPPAEEHARMIEALPDPVLAARADDVRSLGRRAARIAQGAGTDPSTNGSTFILVAEDLGPADVAEHGERAAGIALSAGAVTAHAAIVARSLGIPMTVQAGAELLRVAEGAPILVDGARARLWWRRPPTVSRPPNPPLAHAPRRARWRGGTGSFRPSRPTAGACSCW